MFCSERRPGVSLFRALAALTVLVTTACAPAATSTPAPTPVPVVHVSPAAAPFAESLGRQYLQQRGPLPFDLVPLGSPSARQAVEDGNAALLIDLPPAPQGWFATPLGLDALTVVVNQQVTVRDLDRNELEALLSGRARNWSELGSGELAVQVIVPPPGDRLREQFEGALLGGGQMTSQALLAPTPASAIEMAAQQPGALALVPLSVELQSGVRRIRLEGILPDAAALADGSYLFSYPILALAPEEPGGALREWLVWAQAGDPRAGRP